MLLQRMSEPAPEQSLSAWAHFGKLFSKVYVLAPLAVVLFIIATTAASASALPGDWLYPVKRQVENAQVLLAPTPQVKLHLQVRFTQKRISELEQTAKAVPVNALSIQTHASSSATSTIELSNRGQLLRAEEKQIKATEEARQSLEELKVQQGKFNKSGDKKNADVLGQAIKTFSQELDKNSRGQKKTDTGPGKQEFHFQNRRDLKSSEKEVKGKLQE